MGSIPAELSLNISPTFLPKTISDFLYDVSTIGNAAEKFLRLDDYVKRLEEEMRKIDAFKRELPLCMLIMNDAISTLKDESAKWRIPNSQPVLKEFIPLKKECDQKEKIENEKECRDKKNWMSSVQLCNTSVYPPKANSNYEQKQHFKVEYKKTEGESLEDPFQPRRNIDRNGGFMPFAYSALQVTTTKDDKEDSGLSLLTPSIKNANTGEGSGSSGSRTSSNSVSPPSAQTNLRSAPQQQSSRKQRRCWSPELHRRFVNALQQIGGSQVATPKQIRELMQVDGLTNDEVKSHLQKYRLHTRRVPSATATPAPANQSSVVVLGGLLMSQDQYNDSIKTTSSQSGSPQGPLQLARSARGLSQTEGDSIEDDEEDEKSESYGWKNHLHKPGRVDV